VQPGPVLAAESRNGRVQAIHTGHAVVLDPDGRVRMAWGDPAAATYWRSAAKPLQAVPFVAVAAELGLGDAALAVACGSHAAEPFHVDAARSILATAGLPESALRCGVHDPGPQAGIAPPGGWSAIHNNCSGKHAAMLAVCKRRGWPLEGYLTPDHPLQREIHTVVAEASGTRDVPFGVDGCGLPTYFLPISSLARSFQWLLRDARGVRAFAAMAAESRMVGGTGNSDTETPLATRGRVVSKYGALGVVAAVDRRSGEAVAVKMDAGGSQAARAVALAAMREAGWLDAGATAALEGHLRPPVRNHAGLLLGHLETMLARTGPVTPR
jgi:L-asparaginase II